MYLVENLSLIAHTARSLLLWLWRAGSLRHSLYTGYPETLQDIVGEESLPAQRVYNRAVFAFVSISGAERASVQEKAAVFAKRNGLVLVNSDADGLTFLANYFETHNWPLAVIAFYEQLASASGPESASLRFSASMGPAVVSFTARGVRAEGEDTALVPLLAAQAQPGQLVVTSKIWHALSDSLEGWRSRACSHQVNGFGVKIPSVHLEQRLGEHAFCRECGENLDVRQTADGYITLSCANGHMQQPARPFGRTG